ncbi:glycosyl hydrolase [bacterium]|nr:glycosyl hydrolase [bacterium]
MKRAKYTAGCLLLMMALLFVGCGSNPALETGPKTTTEIILTSAAGAKQSIQENVEFRPGTPSGVIVSVYPGKVKQTIDGIGTSFTESSAFVLAHLELEKRREVMLQIYGESGANFSLTRTHIGACDFCVEGRYSYVDKVGDTDLTTFSIAEDTMGFDPKTYPGVKDQSYDLLPMIQEALSIKSQQQDSELRIIASAWTAPSWMKDIEEWYIPGSPDNNWQGTGGSLKPEYVKTYSDYLLKYLDIYKDAGVDIWGITPVNEPHGNGGQWESMNFSPESQSDFIQTHLGPSLKNSAFSDTRLLAYDQNRDGLAHWSDVIFPADKTNRYVYGVAVHWYESTNKVYEDVFDQVHDKYPDYTIIHTEGCIDDLGKPAHDDLTDPEKFTETNWFDNDAFWWNENATDWAYSVTWEGVAVEDHPAYTPVHRYARNIIESIDHWVTGWVDWNIVLDQDGGPNHVGNFCGAPIMIDTASQNVYYTPIFTVLSQFSRSIRPGDKAVKTHQTKAELEDDDLHACATVNADNLLSVQLLNTSDKSIEYNLQIGTQYAVIKLSENSVQTVRVQL